VLGSLERFIAIITEHYAGAFPLWLAPTQVVVLPITDRTKDYALSIAGKLTDAGLRVETDTRSEKVGFKIREAQMQKIPYMLVLGDKEAESGQVTVRTHKEGDIGTMSIDDILTRLTKEVKDRS